MELDAVECLWQDITIIIIRVVLGKKLSLLHETSFIGHPLIYTMFVYPLYVLCIQEFFFGNQCHVLSITYDIIIMDLDSI